MTKDTASSFDEFKKARIKPRIEKTDKSTPKEKEELLAKAERIKQRVNANKEVR